MPRQSLEERLLRQVVDALSQDRLVLPTLPEVAVRIAQMTQAPDVPVNRLVAEIAKDPAISVRLLRVANSAGQGGAQRAQSLQQAVTRLGLQMTRLLVSGLAMEQMFLSDSPLLKERLRACWHDSVEVGALAQVLAARCTHVQPAMAMLAGLVHQVGVLPILKLAEGDAEIIAQPAVVDQVIAQLGPRVGRLVLLAWNFPPDLAEIPIAAYDFGRQHEGAADCLDVVSLAILHYYGRSDAAIAAVARSRVAAFAQLRLDPATDVVKQLDAAGDVDRQRELLAA